MTYEQFIEQIRNFIATRAKVQPQVIQADTPLIDSGYVDSLLLTELILFVEDLLGCNIDIDDFRISKFETIESIYQNYGHR
ncbi:acyl carrier protein [Verminephrobacter aporrectodeae subsp. tuberculatae]|uniref:acyl carrier protein n=1 Tax=Verminephrobacter aporrectodeae TaxID=1110389 RepID=UPI002242F659|nr:acyl carrier protein [Verminephrobacter aporrectodeae]MCW8206078.1 acyl carrier protein [Verminephrobacter aporrectodeae subsp. tuberculatae]